MKDILNGYKACLSENIIHRDLKPANVLVAKGVFKLSDFGMGRVIEDMGKMFPLSKVGTLAYAAP
jgi:serine/threonine protein kinase